GMVSVIGRIRLPRPAASTIAVLGAVFGAVFGAVAIKVLFLPAARVRYRNRATRPRPDGQALDVDSRECAADVSGNPACRRGGQAARKCPVSWNCAAPP